MRLREAAEGEHLAVDLAEQRADRLAARARLEDFAKADDERSDAERGRRAAPLRREEA